jgi:hypothetical protein
MAIINVAIVLLLISFEALLADGAVLILPKRVQLDYPDNVRIIVEADDFGKVGLVSLTLDKKRLVVDAANLANIVNPDISKIDFQETYDDKLQSKIWIVSFEYFRWMSTWGKASNNVQFIFDESGYNKRITKIQISKDNWEYLIKPAKGAETKYGSGGKSDTGDPHHTEKPSLKLNDKSNSPSGNEHGKTTDK